jgi:uncharacterized surface protein with fasciclin (FAS1) repeats
MTVRKSSILSLLAAALLAVSGSAFAVKPSERTSVLDLAGAVNIATGEFSVLTLALSLYPGIEDVLDGNGQYTVFAPTDEAFANLAAVLPLLCYDDGLVQYVLDNPGYIEDTLLFHVAKGRRDASEVLPAEQIRTLLGAFLSHEPGALEIIDALGGTAQLEGVDQFADNGVIHIISEVLLPYPPPNYCP